MAFQHSLRSKQSLILDGGFGQLIADEYPELDIADDGLWAAGVAIRSPEIIRQIHLRYLDAGADIITTATYQASVDGYIGSGLAINEDDAVSLMTKTISLAIDARNAYMQKSNMSCANPSSVTSSACHLRQPLIAVSLGSIGATLGNCSEYTGAFGHELMPSDIKEFHQRRLSVLLKCLQKPYLQNQIDILAFETIPSLVEVDGIVSALEHVHAVRASDIKLPPAWISFTTRTVDQLGSGEPLHVAAKTASSSPYVHAIGINCMPTDIAAELVLVLKGITIKPIVCYPNGQAWQGSAEHWQDKSKQVLPECFANTAISWVQHGAAVVGGCCRTSPEHTRALATTVQDYVRRNNIIDMFI